MASSHSSRSTSGSEFRFNSLEALPHSQPAHPASGRPRPLPKTLNLAASATSYGPPKAPGSGHGLDLPRRNLSIDTSSPTTAFRPSHLRSPTSQSRSLSVDSPLQPGFGYQVPLALDTSGADFSAFEPRDLDL